MTNELKAAHFTTREDAANAMARPALHWESQGLSNPIDRAEIVENAV